MKKADDLLREAADLFQRKNQEYGDGYLRHGAAMAALMPNGVTLKSSDDFARFALFDLLLVKMVRYASNFHEPHKDSIKDLIVYGAMLDELHEQQ